MKSPMPDGVYAVFDLGTFSVKTSIIKRENSRDRLIAIDSESLRSATEFPNDDEYRRYQVEILAKLKSRLSLRECRDIVALFYHRELLTKIIELPATVQSAQIETLLGWEAKKLLGPNVRSEPSVFSYSLIRRSPPVAALSVVPQNLLEQHLTLYRNAGIRLTGVFCEVFSSLAIDQAVESSGLPTSSLIHVGHASTHVHIFAGSELKFYRHIPSGAAELSRPPTPNELEGLAQKIRFSFDYFRAVSKQTHIDTLQFFGGGAAQHQFFDFSRQYFAPSRVSAADASSQLDISPVLGSLQEIPGSHVQHLGLLPFLPGVGGFFACQKLDRDTTDLLRRFSRQLREEKLAELTKAAPMFIAIIGILILATLLGIDYSSMQQQISDADIGVRTLKTQVDTVTGKLQKVVVSDADQLKSLSSQEKSALRPLLRRRFPASKILHLAFSRKPADVGIEELLILPAEEADSLDLDDSTEEVSPDTGSIFAPSGAGAGAGDSEPKTLVDAVMSSRQNLAAGLGDEVLLIKGIAHSMEGAASYTQALGEIKLCRRLRMFRLGKTTGRRWQFLIRGELP